MKKIPLSAKNSCKNNGKYTTVVDDSDYDCLSQYNWRVRISNRHSLVYATAIIDGKDISMHRFIMGAKFGQTIDHKDGNGLNNQRKNMRFCTVSQNANNKKKQRGTHSSKYKGVSFHKRANRWVVFITQNRKNKYIGLFSI